MPWSLVHGPDTPSTAPTTSPVDGGGRCGVTGAIFRLVLLLVSGIIHGGGGDERDPPGGESQVRPQTSRRKPLARDNGVLPVDAISVCAWRSRVEAAPGLFLETAVMTLPAAGIDRPEILSGSLGRSARILGAAALPLAHFFEPGGALA